MNLYFKWTVGSDDKTTQFASVFSTIFLTDGVQNQGGQGMYPEVG